MNNNQQFSVAIVGGGIVGCSTALYLAREGVDCAVIERKNVGGEASTAAAGVLSHPNFMDDSTSLSQSNSHSFLSKKSYEFYPDFIRHLAKYTNLDPHFEMEGSWYVGFNQKEEEKLRSYYQEMKKYGRSVQWFDGDELSEQYPEVSDSVQCGYYYEEEGKVDPTVLMNLLQQSAQKEGVEIIEHCRVKNLKIRSGKVRKLNTTKGSISVDKVLIAAGCWSKKFEEDLGSKIPVEPRKGIMLQVDHQELGTLPTVWRGEHFVMSRGKKFVLGSTVHDEGFDKSTTLSAIRDLLSDGLSIIPELKNGTLNDHWAGLRPYAAKKGGPFLCRLPEVENGYLAAGHYKTGILQGPYSGYLMAKLMRGKKLDIDRSPYHLNR